MTNALYDSIVSYLSSNQRFAEAVNNAIYGGEPYIVADVLEDQDDFQIRRTRRRFGSIPTVTKIYKNKLFRICIVTDDWEQNEVDRISRDAETLIVRIDGVDKKLN